MASTIRYRIGLVLIICAAISLAVDAEEPTNSVVTNTKSSGSPLTSSDLKRLIDVHETHAAALAESLQKLKANNQDGRHKTAITEQEQKLETALNLAFGFKLEFEEFQIKDMKNRLIQLEHQILQRRRLREQIIAQRRKELLGSELKWDASDESSVASRTIAATPERQKQSDSDDVGATATTPPAVLDEAVPVGATVKASFGLDTPAGNNMEGSGDNDGSKNAVKRKNAIKKFSFNFRYANWDVVLKLFAEMNGLSIDLSDVPPGTFTYSDSREYSMTETLDVLNGYLFSKGFTLIHRDRHLICVKIQTANAPAEFNLDTYRQQFDALTGRIEAAKERVRELEAIYVKDKSNSTEMRQALANVATINAELDRHSEEVTKALDAKLKELEAEKDLNQAKWLRADSLVKTFSTGTVDEDQIKAAVGARSQASKIGFDIQKRMIEMNQAREQWKRRKQDNELMFVRNTPNTDKLMVVRPGAAQAYVEVLLGAELQLVDFDDLGLWFKTALRVRNNRGGFHEGDLIMGLNGQGFGTFEQAAALLSHRNQSSQHIYLRGGLSGSVMRTMSAPINAGEYTSPLTFAAIQSASVKFEVKTRHGMEEPEAIYLEGTCVSPDGLVVVARPSEALGKIESIMAIGQFNMPAHIAAASDEFPLLLVKLDPDRPRLFHWAKGRTELPTRNQQLTIAGDDMKWIVSMDSNKLATDKQTFDVAPSLGGSLRYQTGMALLTMTGELQGLTVEYLQKESKYLAVSASAWQKLIEKYDESRSLQDSK